MKPKDLPIFLLRVLAIVAGLVWLYLAFRAGRGLESESAAQLRTAAFVVGFLAAALAWPIRSQRPGGRNKERL